MSLDIMFGVPLPARQALGDLGVEGLGCFIKSFKSSQTSQFQLSGPKSFPNNFTTFPDYEFINSCEFFEFNLQRNSLVYRIRCLDPLAGTVL